MDLPPGLHAFLVALQAEKVPIEPRQIAWLQYAFALQPQLDRYRLQSLLASVLIKDETQRAVFDVLFDEWCPDRNFELEAETVPDEAPKHTLPQKSPTRSILRRRTATRPGGQTRPAEAVAEAARKRLTAVRLPLPGKWHWWLLAAGAVAVGFGFFFDISQWLRLPGLSEGMLIALSGGSWLSALLLWRFYKQRELPAPLAVARSGPDWLPLPEAAGRDLELLESEAVRSVVWGVGRFVSEELTRQVDLEKTVGATAWAGGVPRIHYQPAVYPREVWLWQDVVTQDPTLPRLVEELEISLKQAGLPVRRGFFAGVPEQVRWQEGETFSPLVLEGHR